MARTDRSLTYALGKSQTDHKLYNYNSTEKYLPYNPVVNSSNLLQIWPVFFISKEHRELVGSLNFARLDFRAKYTTYLQYTILLLWFIESHEILHRWQSTFTWLYSAQHQIRSFNGNVSYDTQIASGRVISLRVQTVHCQLKQIQSTFMMFCLLNHSKDG